MLAKIKFKFECSTCHIYREVELSPEHSTSLDVLNAMALNEAESLGWTDVEENPKCIRCSQILSKVK